MTYSDLVLEVQSGAYYVHHSAWHVGYIPIKQHYYILPYHGRFGDGFALHERSDKSSRYHTITYVIKEVKA